jgi:hypothetical protein
MTGAKDERQNRSCTLVGIVGCLCPNTIAPGRSSIRIVPAPSSRRSTNTIPGSGTIPGPTSSTGPASGCQIGTNGPYRQYSRGELPRPAEIVAGGSRRSVDVLYRLSGVPLPGQNHQCRRDPQYRGSSRHLLPREPRLVGRPGFCPSLFTSPKLTSRARHLFRVCHSSTARSPPRRTVRRSEN